MSDPRESNFLGALMGMAIGDALGAPVAGWDRLRIATEFGEFRTYQPVAGPEGEPDATGEFTDETEIALCLVESMTANRGLLDPETAGFRMLRLALGPSRRWMQSATSAALDAAANSLVFQVPIDEDGPATGDVASRGVPIGLLHSIGALNAARLRDDSERAARLTHGGPAAFNAVTATAFATRLAARGEPRDTWASETAAFLGGGQLAEQLSALSSVRAESDLSSQLEQFGTGLDATQSVTAALAISMHPATFSDAVLSAVRAGGATDTIAAITGALVGAADGIAAIPQSLIDGLQGRIYISLAAPWFYKAARQYAGQLIDLRPVHGPRPQMPPRQ